MGRATQGVTLIGLDEGSQLSGLQRILENDAVLDDHADDNDIDHLVVPLISAAFHQESKE